MGGRGTRERGDPRKKAQGEIRTKLSGKKKKSEQKKMGEGSPHGDGSEGSQPMEKAKNLKSTGKGARWYFTTTVELA